MRHKCLFAHSIISKKNIRNYIIHVLYPESASKSYESVEMCGQFQNAGFNNILLLDWYGILSSSIISSTADVWLRDPPIRRKIATQR